MAENGQTLIIRGTPISPGVAEGNIHIHRYLPGEIGVPWIIKVRPFSAMECTGMSQRAAAPVHQTAGFRGVQGVFARPSDERSKRSPAPSKRDNRRYQPGKAGRSSWLTVTDISFGNSKGPYWL